jgi:ABC-type lipoprotein export system ATPase subunit
VRGRRTPSGIHEASGALLEIEHVSAMRRHGHRIVSVLDDVTLAVDPGELVAVYGRRKSGRTTLLRIAGGIDTPTSGAVRFRGVDLRQDRNAGLTSEIGVVHRSFHSVARSQPAFLHVAVAGLAQRVPLHQATMRAHELLDRVDAPSNASLAELDAHELTLVALARALAGRPRLLLVDEPTQGLELMERGAMSRLLRSLADEGLAVLVTAPDTGAAAGATRVLHLTAGKLRGQTDISGAADVVPLLLQRRGPR